ncbi:MAG: tRNA (guanosine(46)-N7)-methyltransferase TrmB [Lachnospiraceae bacterium]|nr:tRNA (guanosine(46)-N7)-methyltransferase TrmB [Lachnospiraceae bacterium]
MRLRNIPGARDAIEASPWTVKNPEEMKGKWRTLFPENCTKIHLEIGTGKGRFIMHLAELHPDICYVGIEKYSSVLLRCLEKQDELQLPNLVFIRGDAELIGSYFDEGEIDRIYLNFSDPWPKARHARRRLPSKEFLARYDGILAEGGTIEFKTDNRALFDFAVEEVAESVFRIDRITYDLHHDPEMNAGNIMTEYEKKFSQLGNKICKYILVRKEDGQA